MNYSISLECGVRSPSHDSPIPKFAIVADARLLLSLATEIAAAMADVPSSSGPPEASGSKRRSKKSRDKQRAVEPIQDGSDAAAVEVAETSRLQGSGRDPALDSEQLEGDAKTVETGAHKVRRKRASRRDAPADPTGLDGLPLLKTASRSRKTRAVKERSEQAEAVQDPSSAASSSTWPYLRLSEPLGASARLAPVFSHDGRSVGHLSRIAGSRETLSLKLLPFPGSAS